MAAKLPKQRQCYAQSEQLPSKPHGSDRPNEGSLDLPTKLREGSVRDFVRKLHEQEWSHIGTYRVAAEAADSKSA